ncbi:hypothetical protein ACRAWD_25500 [Caulobacter segnis]
MKDVDALALEADRLMDLGDKVPARQAELYTQAGNILVAGVQAGSSPLSRLWPPSRAAGGARRTTRPDNTMTALLTALRLAHRRWPRTASRPPMVLIKRSRPREAIIVLGPLANSPHDGELSKKAREMMIEAGKAAPL